MPNTQKRKAQNMKKGNKKYLYFALITMTAFILWTILVRNVDVKAIGPRGSSVGLATINAFFHNLTGVNMALYTITDWLGLVPIFIAFGFGILGLIQWISAAKSSFTAPRSKRPITTLKTSLTTAESISLRK